MNRRSTLTSQFPLRTATLPGLALLRVCLKKPNFRRGGIIAASNDVPADVELSRRRTLARKLVEQGNDAMPLGGHEFVCIGQSANAFFPILAIEPMECVIGIGARNVLDHVLKMVELPVGEPRGP